MKIILQPKREYVFRLNGNRDLPVMDQAKMTYRQPNAIERRLLKTTNVKPTSSGAGSVDVHFDVEKIFSQQDVVLEGIEVETVDTEGKTTSRKITSGSDLVRTPSKLLTALAEEAMNEIMSMDYEDELLKNSESASEPSSKGKAK